MIESMNRNKRKFKRTRRKYSDILKQSVKRAIERRRQRLNRKIVQC